MTEATAALRLRVPPTFHDHAGASQDRRFWLATGAILACLIGWLILLGRPWVPGAPLRLWNSELSLVHNSQHLADAYSLLHLSFGAVIYKLARRFNSKLKGARLTLTAVASAALWEAIENLPWVIAAFNPPGSVSTYGGDSVVNALADVAFFGAGFALASRLAPAAVWAGVVGVELACAALINDGFALGSTRLLLGG